MKLNINLKIETKTFIYLIVIILLLGIIISGMFDKPVFEVKIYNESCHIRNSYWEVDWVRVYNESCPSDYSHWELEPKNIWWIKEIKGNGD